MKKSITFLATTLALAGLALHADDAKPLKILLITGGCCHDYKAQKDILKKGLEERINAEVTQVHTDDGSTKPPLAFLGNPDYAKGFDVVIHDECSADFGDLPANVPDAKANDLQAKVNAATAPVKAAQKALQAFLRDEVVGKTKIDERTTVDLLKTSLKPDADPKQVADAVAALKKAYADLNPAIAARNLEVVNDVLAPHQAGIPGVNLHCAMHCYRFGDYGKAVPAGADNSHWYEYLGLQSTGHGAQLPITLTVLDEKNPITSSLTGWVTGKEELYNNIQILTGKALARGAQGAGDKKGQNDTVVVWTNEYGPKKTKVFSTTVGHNNTTVSDPKYLDLVAKGVLFVTDKMAADGKPIKGYEPKAH